MTWKLRASSKIWFSIINFERENQVILYILSDFICDPINIPSLIFYYNEFNVVRVNIAGKS